MPDIKLSAGINFGKPETEFIVESTPQGVATSCRNVRTNTEYIGGGGGDFSTAEVVITSNISISLYMVQIVNGEMVFGASYENPTAETLNVVLYNGTQTNVQLWDLDSGDEVDNSNVTVTGDIVKEEHGLTINGNGTVVINVA